MFRCAAESFSRIGDESPSPCRSSLVSPERLAAPGQLAALLHWPSAHRVAGLFAPSRSRQVVDSRAFAPPPRLLHSAPWRNHHPVKECRSVRLRARTRLGVHFPPLIPPSACPIVSVSDRFDLGRRRSVSDVARRRFLHRLGDGARRPQLRASHIRGVPTDRHEQERAGRVRAWKSVDCPTRRHTSRRHARTRLMLL